MHASKIIKIGEKFRNRIENEILNAALNYTKYNEETLAIEVLCDHIVEYRCSINAEEYKELIDIIYNMGIDPDNPPFKYLKSQIS